MQTAEYKPIDGLVSVIMPVYNCEKYLPNAIESVLNQTYSHLELIAVNDCSTDNSEKIIRRFCEMDNRVKYIKLDLNSGAAVARNTAVQAADGEFLAFLDSDDMWKPRKLEKQIAFMKEHSISFSCTSYETVNEFGKPTGEIRVPKTTTDYNRLLYHNPGNSTVVYSAKELGKTIIPSIRKRNDYVMWLSVIKKATTLHGLQEVLTSYRVRPDSLSINKMSLVNFHLSVYRDIEKLPWHKTLHLMVFWIGKTMIRRIRIPKVQVHHRDEDRTIIGK